MSGGEIIGLSFYFLQQLGMTLGVGGYSFVLLTHGTFAVQKKARKAVSVGLWMVVISGAAITAAHLIAGQAAIVSSPAFILKWVLISIVIAGPLLLAGIVEVIVVGGTWYALFALHVLAPQATWAQLSFIYFGWMGLWAAGILLRSGGHRTLSVVAPRKTVTKETSVPESPREQKTASRAANAFSALRKALPSPSVLQSAPLKPPIAPPMPRVPSKPPMHTSTMHKPPVSPATSAHTPPALSKTMLAKPVISEKKSTPPVPYNLPTADREPDVVKEKPAALPVQKTNGLRPFSVMPRHPDDMRHP